MPHEKAITELQTKVAVLESKMDGVESDLDSIKLDIKAIRENNKEEFKAIRESINKILIGGLSSTVLLLIGIIVNIIMSKGG